MKKRFFFAAKFLALLAALVPMRLRGQSAPLPTPHPKAESAFAEDVFTFVRLHPQEHRSWHTDAPDADMNLCYRLQQLTTMRVDQTPLSTHEAIIMEITDPNLVNFPFVYSVEPGYLHLTEEEAEILRKHLLNGGFYMLDDFWGEREWANVYEQLKKIFPDREPVELELDHPIFHCVFDLKEKPQIPGIEFALRRRGTGIIWERPDAKGAHYRAIYDDKGRIMVLVCQNTDLGDSWEREGDDPWYFHEFSEKKGYPMTINIMFYLMTH